MGIENTLTGDVGASTDEMADLDRGYDPVYGNDAHCRQGKGNRRVETLPRTDRTLTLAVAAKEYIWLYDRRHGMSINEIAAREGLNVNRVRYGLKRARAIDKKTSRDVQSGPWNQDADIVHAPRLIPLFPIGPYTPQSTCPHREAIEQGSALCCMVCHNSGMDAHPSLRRDPQTEPAPEPQDEPAPDLTLRFKTGESLETRKQRRRRMFAQQAATAPSR